MKVEFNIPCLVQGRIGRKKALRSVVTVSPLEIDVPVVDEGFMRAYTVQCDNPAEGYRHYFSYQGAFYTGMRVFEAQLSNAPWPSDIWLDDNALTVRLWDAVLEVMLEKGVTKGQDENLFDLVTALTARSLSDRTEAWESLSSEYMSGRKILATSVCVERAHAKASKILEGLVLHQGELFIVTGRPCYVVDIDDRDASVGIGNTDVHRRMRNASFENEVFYPFADTIKADGLGRHYFAIEDREGMNGFITASGLRRYGRTPDVMGLAADDGVIDGLELDRIARLFLHETAMAVRRTASFLTPGPLMLGKRGLFGAFFDLRDFLEERNDPQAGANRLADLLSELVEAMSTAGHHGEPLGHDSPIANARRALSRFTDRRIDPFVGTVSAGSLPEPW